MARLILDTNSELFAEILHNAADRAYKRIYNRSPLKAWVNERSEVREIWLLTSEEVIASSMGVVSP